MLCTSYVFLWAGGGERGPERLPGDGPQDFDCRLRRAPGKRERRAFRVETVCVHLQHPLQG